LLGHSDNFIKADPLVTPIHIVPEWYFLPFHAIPRSVPNKFFGVLLMLSSIFILFFLPYLDRSNYVISPKLNSSYEYFFWIFFLNILILGWLGSMPVEEPYLFFSRLSTFFYFFCFVFLYVFTVIENKIFNYFFVFKTK
jgi:ubiquinol-cytochrome c reductase cytochrome b subunit